MQEIANLLQDLLNWVADQPPGIIGFIAAIMLVFWVVRKLMYG